MENFIVYNAIRTPDGTLLESKYRHDFVAHIDTKTGGHYIVDGGHDYLKRSVPHNYPYEELSLNSSSPFEEIRKVHKRGSYGKNGNEKLKYIKLCEMSDEYLKRAIDYVSEHDGKFSNLVLLYYRELYYRCEHNITIEE